MTKGVIAYLRASNTDPNASDQALADQQASLAQWLVDNRSEVVAQFIEVEGESAGRPRLAGAICASRRLGLPLVIVSLQAIGSGASFSPRVTSVPVIVLPQPAREAPQIIACPFGNREEVCLHVGRMVEGRLPLYLCNPRDVALTNVTVRGGALQLGMADLIPTCSSTLSFAFIEPQKCVLLEQHDVNLEGDFLDCLQIAFDRAGLRFRGAVLLRNLLQVERPIRIAFDPR